MAFIDTLPIWLLALLIFSLRVGDVTLGTIRTISVVNGRITLSVVLGFFEVIIWLVAAAQAITRVREDPLLLLAFAGGFAAGNGVGIAIEQKMALGRCVLRILSGELAECIVQRLSAMGHAATTFRGQGSEGPRSLIYIPCRRRHVQKLLDAAHEVDPSLFFVVETASQSTSSAVFPHPTGWRALFKKK